MSFILFTFDGSLKDGERVGAFDFFFSLTPFVLAVNDFDDVDMATYISHSCSLTMEFSLIKAHEV